MVNLPEPTGRHRYPVTGPPLPLRVCFHRLHLRPGWLRTWLSGWAILLAWSAYAFLAAPNGIAIAAQAVFFLALFPWILLPVASALGRTPCPAP